MGKVYKSQDALRIELTTDVNIENALIKRIKYKDPDGIEGYWDALSEDEENGVIYYDLPKNSPLNKSGKWTFWAYITFPDGRSAPGEPVAEYIYIENGEVI